MHAHSEILCTERVGRQGCGPPGRVAGADPATTGDLAAGDTERAIESYEKSLELDPDNGNAVEKLREIRGG